jgi:hypothetical protein
MNFFLVEPNYYKFRIIVEAKSQYGARNKAKKWLLKNKGVYIEDHELEVEKIRDPKLIKDFDVCI